MSRIEIEIDGTRREVEAGQDLLTAALLHGVDVPHFCWHDALGSVGACRLCAVRVHDDPNDDAGHIEMACMTPAREGQRVELADPEAHEMRARVIEWLMVNHPHDCAVCEEGGACHLQDMTVATGHHRRRHRFEKRTHRNQDLGPLLTHEMNRCIACYRCTRFYRHYAGGRDLDVFGAHDRVYFGRYEDGPLESPFAGNLAEICPTGVFNDRGWSQDYARKWDMAATPSVCGQCSVGCAIFVAERGGRVRRVQNRYHAEINGHFLCDRGRFGALHVAAPGRIAQARVRGEAVDGETARDAARAAVARGAVAIASPRGSLETAFALRHLAGAERVFAAVPEREAHATARMAALLARYTPASLARIERADAALVLGEDLTGTAPRAALALRQTARRAADRLAEEKGVPVWLDNAARVAGEGRRSPIALVTALPDALDEIATVPLRRTPAEIARFGHDVAAALNGDRVRDGEARAVAEALAQSDEPVVIAGFGTGRGDVAEAAAAVAAALDGKAALALFPAEANSLGLSLIAPQGIEGAVRALETGAARTAIVAEADLHERVPAALVERLFAAAETVIALDAEPTRTTARADILLPVAGWDEAAGTLVNHEGRAQRRFAAYAAERPAPWRAIAGLCAEPPGWRALDDVLAGVTGPRPKEEAEPEGEGLTLLPLHEPFAGDEIGRHADLLAARCPPPVVAINPEDAARLGLDAGAHVELDGHAAPVPLTLDRAVPKGHLAASAGRVLPRAAGARIRVTRQHWEER